MIALRVPYPPTTNNLFSNVPGKGRVKSKEYKLWIEQAGWVIKGQRQQPVSGPVTFALWATRPDKRRRDLTNLVKPIEDLIVKLKLIDDDSQVQQFTAGWVDWDPGCFVMICPVTVIGRAAVEAVSDEIMRGQGWGSTLQRGIGGLAVETPPGRLQ